MVTDASDYKDPVTGFSMNPFRPIDTLGKVAGGIITLAVVALMLAIALGTVLPTLSDGLSSLTGGAVSTSRTPNVVFQGAQ